ncbi:MAG: SDR family oxidoreductase [Candidatus Rokubacteria bacterium]|nr:SDR family oxidoreductase [Candidatus Rokubacteria bacterium]
MDLELSDRTALVTGASMGIGRAIALELAREGVTVTVTARRRDLLTELAVQMEQEGHKKPFTIQVDLYRDDAVATLVASAEDAFGQIDILVNAAGGSRPLPVEATSEQWTEGLTVNFLRLRELTHALILGMEQRRWGRVINITGTSEPRGLNAAVAAKAAVHAWAKGLSREVARFGITINSIQPGRVLSEQILRMHPTEEDRRQFAEREIPTGRFGDPREVASLAVFLASPRGSYITGAVIPVDGGMRRFAF